MDRVVDLTAEDSTGAAALERTGTDGFLGSSYLRDDPPAEYLLADESPKFIVRNKSAGISVEGETHIRAVQPDSDHQALAVVTDLRILYLVGHTDGDRAQTLSLVDVTTATADSSGLRTQELTVKTNSNALVSMPVRGGLSPVADFIDDAATTCAEAVRTLERAADAIDAATEDVAAGEFEAARTAIEDLEEYVEDALRDLHELGSAPLAEALPEAKRLVERTRGLRREAIAGLGLQAHERAQSAWSEGDYEAAARAYGEAFAAYERAGEVPGGTPTAETLDRRRRLASAERVILRRAPLWDLLAMKREAAVTDQPDAAAAAWEEALSRARGLESIEWPFPDASLAVDGEFRWDTVAECARAAVDARQRAAKRWARAGDRLGEEAMTPTARDAYERACDHAERALTFANESVPDRVAEVEETAARLTARLGDDGAPAPSPAPEGPLAAEVLADLLGTEAGDEAAPPVAAGEDGGPGEVASDADGVATDADSAEARPRLPPGFDLPPGLDDEFARAEPVPAETGTGTGWAGTSAESGSPSPAEESSGTPPDPRDDDSTPDPDTIEDGLARLGATEFAEVVARVWEARGWSTMVLPETGATVYDILGAKGAPDEDRLLVWTVHRPDGDIEEGFVDRIAETTERGGQDLRLVLVTTARVPPAVGDRADAAGVEIVAAEDLASSIRDVGLHDRLPDVN